MLTARSWRSGAYHLEARALDGAGAQQIPDIDGYGYASQIQSVHRVVGVSSDLTLLMCFAVSRGGSEVHAYPTLVVYSSIQNPRHLVLECVIQCVLSSSRPAPDVSPSVLDRVRQFELVFCVLLVLPRHIACRDVVT